MSFIIDQEAWLSYYAEMLGVDTTNLGERHLRFALAAYHGIYVPTAATVELRANELDTRQRYAEFGFVPNTPTFAAATLRVTLPNAATTTFVLGAPFIVRQEDLSFVARTPLVVESGSTTGEAEVVALMQGSVGTPASGAASIVVSAGWLRRAAIEIIDVVPGSDGDSREEIRRAFQTYAFDPKALVRADDHAQWIVDNYPAIDRAFAHPRSRITDDGVGNLSSEVDIAGHLAVALIGAEGGLASPEDVADVKEGLLRVTIPYGEDHLHVVAATPLSITGSIVAVIEPGVNEDDVKENILTALDTHFDWRTWPRGRNVYAGEMWSVVNSVPNVRYTQDIDVGAGEVITLDLWQYPINSFTEASITLVGEM